MRFRKPSAYRARQSRDFVQASAAKLREMQERDLSGENVVAMFLDGNTFARATSVAALGITISGENASRASGAPA